MKDKDNNYWKAKLDDQSYKVLREKVLYLSKKFKNRSTNIVLCTNTIDSIVIYLSLLYIGAIPLLLSKELDKSTIKFYREKYKSKTIIFNKRENLYFSNRI